MAKFRHPVSGEVVEGTPLKPDKDTFLDDDVCPNEKSGKWEKYGPKQGNPVPDNGVLWVRPAPSPAS